MDNFMDKLAKRFSAGDLIKANQAAEERELKRAREQAEENEKLLQEIRRLNLKNVELSEQVGQLIQCGIEQFEEYDRTAGKAEAAYENSIEGVKTILSRMEEAVNQSAEASASIPGKLVDAKAAFQDEIGSVKEAIAAVDAKVSEESNQDVLLEKMQDTLLEEVVKLKESIKALEEYVHRENVKVYRNVQAVVVEQTTQKARELGDRLDVMEKSSKKTGGLVPLLAVTFLVSLASLLLQLARMFSLF